MGIVVTLLWTSASTAQRVTEFKAPALGAVFTFRISDKGKYVGTSEYAVLPDQNPFDGRSAYRIRERYTKAAGKKQYITIRVFDKEHGNAVAFFGSNGKIRARFRPHVGTLNWPMFVGKSWTHTYTSERERRKSKIGPYTHSVAAYETITVPAGSFRAFRIVSTKNATSRTTWFAPKLGILVKQSERKNGRTTFSLVLIKAIISTASGGAN